MSGEFYLLNALWFGAALVIVGACLHWLWHVVRFMIVMCLPFGIVAFYHVIADSYRVLRDHRKGDGGDNVVEIPEKK